MSLIDHLGLHEVPDEVNLEPMSDLGEHEAARVVELVGPGSCLILLGVTETSRVETGVVAGTDTANACTLAMRVATLVEKELP